MEVGQVIKKEASDVGDRPGSEARCSAKWRGPRGRGVIKENIGEH